MTWSSFDTWIVVIGALCAASCALLGSYLVLRRMSMMGDAISHAVLPGLAAAFLLTESRDSLTMLAGAAVVGVLTAVFVEWIHRLGGVEESAAMGVVFTTLFAIGLISIVQAADAVDLDPGCVLYGAIELAPLTTVRILGLDVPSAAVTLAVVLIANIGLVTLLWKELEISTFDPALATTLGISSRAMHYVLMAMVAVTTVASFEAVGSILVIAMLIVPAAVAGLLTERLPAMILGAVFIAVLCAPLGHIAATIVPRAFGYTDTGTAGMMAVTAGFIFFAALLLAPRRGIVSRLWDHVRLSVRIREEDVLGALYRREEARARRQGRADRGMDEQGGVEDDLKDPLTATGAGRTIRRLAVAGLRRRGLVLRSEGAWGLTEQGRLEARRLVRAHRLWEVFLHDQARMTPAEVHPSAHLLEHVTDASLRERLAAATEAAKRDPHGAPIPGEAEEG
jgi:manganese/zinc/iron transport system permease protein